MCNASDENRPTTPNTRGACPSWCVDHDRTDVGHRDEAITHLGPVREPRTPREDSTVQVQLTQVEFVHTGGRYEVFLRVDDDLLPPAEAARDAAELAAVLADEAARAGMATR
jgi:hypothetical protein